MAENYIHSLWLTPDYDEKALRYAVRADDPAGARITVLCGGQVSGVVDGRKTNKLEVGALMTRVEGGKADE